MMYDVHNIFRTAVGVHASTEYRVGVVDWRVYMLLFTFGSVKLGRGEFGLDLFISIGDFWFL